MSDINWDLAPEGAVAIKRTRLGKMFFINKDGYYYHGVWKLDFCDKWKTIATRPQPERKTVEDAVNYIYGHCEGVWACSLDALCYVDDAWFYDKSGLSKHQVCTREEFEACVAAECEPEWTHTDAFGDPCRVLIDEPDSMGQVIILRQDGWYSTVAASSLKPIKPTITKAAEDALVEFMKSSHKLDVINEVRAYINSHDITN
tara:strand:- start:18082 stop:18687 length:606 start_codon:yes stop_codon:yes gene_type:complete